MKPREKSDGIEKVRELILGNELNETTHKLEKLTIRTTKVARSLEDRLELLEKKFVRLSEKTAVLYDINKGLKKALSYKEDK